MTEREKGLLLDKFGSGCDLALCEKRLNDGEPLAYILGEWYFWDETYRVTPDVLIPRPDTEHLAEAAIKALGDGGRLLDLCTGSGCVAISTVKHTKNTTGIACDISKAALEIARENAEANGVSDRITFRRLDVLERDALASLGRFKVVTSNPPYIRTDVIPTLETVQHEPKQALDGGNDGLVFYRALTAAFDILVDDGGVMLLEIGYDQGEDIKSICRAVGLSCTVRRDYSGNDRVAVVVRT